MGESTSQYFAMRTMSCPVCDRSTGRCHAMIPKTSSDSSTPLRMQLGISMLQEIHDHVRAMPLRMLGLEIRKLASF